MPRSLHAFRTVVPVALAAVVPAHGQAADLTIAGDSGVQNGGFVLGVGDTLTLNRGATVTPGAATSALFTLSDGTTITANGNTVTSGAAAGMQIGGTGSTGLSFGTITHTGPNGGGMTSVGASDTLTNNGTIAVSGDDTFGMRVQGATSTATNAGTITNTGTAAVGMQSDVTGTLANTGTITTSGTTAFGIYSIGDDGTITNSGTVSSTNASAVMLRGKRITLTNTGLLSGSGVAGFAINTTVGTSNDATVINSGTITSDGSGTIFFADAGPSLTNTGLISVASGGTAVFYSESTTEFFNAGRVIAPSGTAVFFADAENTLTLDTGAFVEGNMVLGGSSFVTINTGAANSFDFSFTGSQWFAINVTGTTPFVIDTAGQRVASIDPTQYDATRNGAGNLAGQVLGISTLRAHGLLGGGPVSVSTKYGPPPADPVIAVPPRRAVWAAPFAEVASYATSGNNLPYQTQQFGAVAGVDVETNGATELGVFGAFAAGRYGANGVFATSHRIQTTSALAGLYGVRDLGRVSLDFGIVGGIQGHASQRSINNNLVAGGVDIASGSYTSFFLAPQASLSRERVTSRGLTFSMKAGVALTAGRVAGFTETFTGGTATTNARNFAVGTGEASVEVSRTVGQTEFAGSVGLFARSGFGGEAVSGTLLGLPWSYTDTSASGIGGTVRLAVTHQFGSRVTGAVQASSTFGSTNAAEVKGSASLTFEF